MTQREAALAGTITSAMLEAAEKEGMMPEVLREKVAKGIVAIPANVGHRNLEPIAIGSGVRVKINANIGTSPHDINLEKEKAKLAAAIRYGAHTVMDLSTGGDLNAIRTALLTQCSLPFGTVPI
jgi:phosphomethylpyrimidine synthase